MGDMQKKYVCIYRHVHIYIYDVYVCGCMCINIYIYIYIVREFTVEHQLIPIVWDYGRYVNIYIYMCVYYQPTFNTL